MLAWLRAKASLEGSIWLGRHGALVPEDLASLRDPRVVQSEPEWSEPGVWRMSVNHPQLGSLAIKTVPRPPPVASALASFHRLTQVDRVSISGAQSAVFVEMQPSGSNVLRDRKNLLRALALVGGADSVVAVDHLAQRVWPKADLEDELAHDADLDVESAISVHGVTNDESSEAEWFHTHGIAALGGFDFHIVQPRPGAELNEDTEVVRTCAGLILEGSVRIDGDPFRLFGDAMACFVPVEAFLANSEGYARKVLATQLEGDEFHRAIAAVLCNPGRGGMFGRLFGRASRPAANDAVWEGIEPGGATAPITAAMTALMEQRAAATYEVLRRLVAEFEQFGFPVGIKLGYETGAGGREHLWFRPHSLGDESIDATLENAPFAVPGMKLGDRGTHPVSRITDWMIATPVGRINPRSQVAARIARERPDEIAAAMKAGWPG
jgi:uncharacterized protein YegJ (DUF2314 family)